MNILPSFPELKYERYCYFLTTMNEIYKSKNYFDFKLLNLLKNNNLLV